MLLWCHPSLKHLKPQKRVKAKQEGQISNINEISAVFDMLWPIQQEQ